MSSARSLLRGELATFGLGSLLTILEMERQGGMLILSRGRQLGRVIVSKGRVLRARVEGRPRREGVDAVYELLSWPEGQFELWHSEVEGPDEIRMPTAFLLMEGARRMDEARAARASTDGDPFTGDQAGDAI